MSNQLIRFSDDCIIQASQINSIIKTNDRKVIFCVTENLKGGTPLTTESFYYTLEFTTQQAQDNYFNRLSTKLEVEVYDNASIIKRPK